MNRDQNTAARLQWFPVAFPVAALILLILANTSAPARWDEWLSLTLLGLGTALIIALHVWAAALNPVEHFVSEYSLLPSDGIWMRIAFFCLGLSVGNLAISLGRFDQAKLLLTIPLFIAGIFGVCMGICSMRVATRSVSGEIQVPAWKARCTTSRVHCVSWRPWSAWRSTRSFRLGQSITRYDFDLSG